MSVVQIFFNQTYPPFKSSLVGKNSYLFDYDCHLKLRTFLIPSERSRNFIRIVPGCRYDTWFTLCIHFNIDKNLYSCRSGKSSIQRVVFHKMSPNETLFLESTNAIHKENVSNSSFVQFAVWDFPGKLQSPVSLSFRFCWS